MLFTCVTQLCPLVRPSSSSPFPDILGVGPAIEDGFYYAGQIVGQIQTKTFPVSKKKMKNSRTKNFPSIREEVTKDEVREIFKTTKLELIEEHSEDVRRFDYSPSGHKIFAGPHVPSTGRASNLPPAPCSWCLLVEI